MTRTALALRLSLGALCGVAGAYVGQRWHPPPMWIAAAGALAVAVLFGLVVIARRSGG